MTEHTSSRVDLNNLNYRPVVRLLAWAILIWSGLASWGRLTLIGDSTREPLGIANWDVYFDGLIAISPILFIVVPPLLWWFGRRFFQSEAWRNERVLWVCLMLFGGLQLARYVLDFDRFTVVAGLLMAVLLSLAVLWLFDRESISMRHVFVTLAYGMLIFALLDTLPAAAIEEPLAWQTSSTYRGLIFAGLAITALSPGLLLLSSTRRIIKGLYERSLAIPTVVLASSIGLFTIIQLSLQFLDLTFQPWHALALIPAILPGLLLALRIEAASDATPEPSGARTWPWLLLITALYITLALIWMPHWKGYITPDGYVYLEVARRYSEGEFAVRGHWSPLISWLIAGPVALGISPEIAARSLLMVCGASSIWLIEQLGSNLGFNRRIRLAAAALMAAFALRHYFWALGPDQLAATILLAYFVIATHPRRNNRSLLYGIVAGVFGALAYFAKAFSLPFMIAHLVLAGLLAFRDQRGWRSVVTFTLAAFVVIVGLVAPWVGQMQQRYDRVVILTRGYANARYGPYIEVPFQQFCRLTICPHPDDVLFPWEDPEDQAIEDLKWKTFDSLETFQFRMRLISDNMNIWWRETLTANLGILPLLAWLGLVIAAIVHWTNADQRRAFDWLALTLIIYVGGYILVKGSEFRLHYPVVALFILATVYFVDHAATRLTQEGVDQRIALLLIPLILSTMILRPSRHTPAPAWIGESDQACLERDSTAIGPDLAAPFVGVGRDVTALSYYTQTRSIGSFEVHRDTETIAELTSEYGIASLVVYDRELAQELEDDFDFQLTAEHTFCQARLWVMVPPTP